MYRTVVSALLLSCLLVCFPGVVAPAAMASPPSKQTPQPSLSIVGSSTVYPFALLVADQLEQKNSDVVISLEQSGTNAGFKLFCQRGGNRPDILNASRRLTQAERQICQKQGVNDLVEIQIGYDGIVIANSKLAKQMSLTRKELYLALAAKVPSASGKLVPNPNTRWSDINSTLPNIEIKVYGPPPGSGTRDAFMELVMEAGAKKIQIMRELRESRTESPTKQILERLGIQMTGDIPLGKKAFKSITHHIRKDGHFVEAGENDENIVKDLEANPQHVGIFGFSFLKHNAKYIQGAMIEDVPPEFESIAEGDYPVSRKLYFYVKKDRINKVKGLESYLMEFSSEAAWGDKGYLVKEGLIPMPKMMRETFRDNVIKGHTLSGIFLK